MLCNQITNKIGFFPPQFLGSVKCLTISVRQAGVPAHRAVTLEDDRPLDRHASGDCNGKFLNLFSTNCSTMWCHVLYIAFEGDVSAIQWCYICLSLSGSLFNTLQLFSSFSHNPKLLQWRTVLTTLAICRVMF